MTLLTLYSAGTL